MKKLQLFAAGAAGLALSCAGAAHAQSIDYGSLEQLFNEPVTTSATGSPQRSTEAPADMQIISQEQIRQSGETTLPGILQRVAGVDVINPSAGHSDVNVRGYDQVSSPRLLVLVNGRQVYLDHYGMTVWQTIPVQLSEIRQIEVVKGPNSALFGFNAVSGVVNIITYNPKFDATNEVKAYAGNNGQRGGSVVGTFKLGKAISARLSAGASVSDEWERPSDLPTALPLTTTIHDPERVSTALDVVAQLADKTELRMEGSWSNAQQSVLIGNSYAVTKAITSSAKATLASDTRYGLIQGTVYQNKLDAKYSIVGGVNWNNTITVASLQDLFKVGTAHTFRIGGEYRHNTLNVAPLETGDVSYDVLSASAMWNWAVNEKLTTTAAVRIDNLDLKRTGTFGPRNPLNSNELWDRTITEPSVNVTVAYRPTAQDTFRASFARGVQAPSLIELGGLQLRTPIGGGLNAYIQGNPNIKPSIVTNYELAYDHEFKSVKVGARVFAQKWEDLKSGVGTRSLDLLPTATTDAAIFYINTSDSKMKGFELTASGKLAKGFSWHADYTYTDVEDTLFPGVNATARYVAFEDTTPESRGNVGATWVGGPWEVDANVHYVGDFQWYDMTTGNLAPVDGYASLSSRVAYRMENGLTFAVSGQNLLHDAQKQTRGLEAERRVQATISKAW